MLRSAARNHVPRGTYGQLGYGAGVPITQMSKLLGHSSVVTTASDFVPFG